MMNCRLCAHDPPRENCQINRRGVIIVEAAIVISVILVVIIGTLDLSFAVLQYNTLSEISRKLSRQAIVHGVQAEKVGQGWGPATYDGTAADNSVQATSIRGLLVSVAPADVKIRLEWIDGDNALDHRVRATSSLTYVPMIRVPFLKNSYALTSTSVMRITY